MLPFPFWKLAAIIKRNMETISTTRSLCPVCLKPLPARLVLRGEKIYIQKSCSSHGEFEDLYYGDAALYHHIMEQYSGRNQNSPKVTSEYDVLLPVKGYSSKSTPVIGIIDVTNRCNLECNVCFAGCSSAPTLYEPTFDEIAGMMDTLRSSDPPCPIVLFSGGEPTIRKDFFEICTLAHQKGFSFIIVATNGKMLAANEDYYEKLNKAHVDIIYLQFDGLTPEPYLAIRGTDLLPLKMKAIRNMINSSVSYPNVVLVPTVIKGVNDHQIGDIVRFAAANITNIRGILFQPIGYVGDVKDEKLLNGRITNAECLEQLERSFDGKINKMDFVPLAWIRDFLDAYKRLNPTARTIDISTHPGCFSIVYLIKHNEELIPLSRIFDLNRLRSFIRSLEPCSKQDLFKKFSLILPGLIKKEGIKFSGKLLSVIRDLFMKGAEEAIIKFHTENVLLVGFEHAIDANNYDCDKVENCCIHYSTPENDTIPFCAYNLLHRKRIEEEFRKDREGK